MSETASISAADLAARLGGSPHGDAARIIAGVATLDLAGPDEISWAQDIAYLARAEASLAGVLLIPASATPPAGRTCISVADPELAMVRVLEWFAPPVPRVPTGVSPAACVDPTAIVDGAAIGPHVFVGSRARVAAGAQLHPGVYVGADSVIGRDCVLWPNVVVRERVTIGERVIIHPNTTIGSDGFGYIFRDGRHRKVPQIGTVVIEDDVELGANVAIDRAKCGVTRIGRGTKIDNLVQIAHNAQIGPDCILVAGCAIAGSSSTGRGVVLAGQVGLAEHVHVGDGAQVAAQSGTMRDVPAGQIYRGSPAIPLPDYQRQQAAVRKLPRLLEQWREFRKRVERLESSADHKPGD